MSQHKITFHDRQGFFKVDKKTGKVMAIMVPDHNGPIKNISSSLQEYLKRECPALAKHTELNPRACDQLLDACVEEPEKLFRIFWTLNILCTIKQLSSKFSKKDFIALLNY
jgi:hypothetical protein